jgi:hypothetical protein
MWGREEFVESWTIFATPPKLSAADKLQCQDSKSQHTTKSTWKGQSRNTSLQHLPGLPGACLTTKDQGADPVRSRRWLQNATHHQGSRAWLPVPSLPGYFSPGLRVSCVRSVRYLHTPGIVRNVAGGTCNVRSIARVATRRMPTSMRS